MKYLINESRLQKLVYMYLDELFEKVEIEENEYGMRGMVNDDYLLFTYFPNINVIFFSKETFHMIRLMFGDGVGHVVSNYVREYLTNKFNRDFTRARFNTELQ